LNLCAPKVRQILDVGEVVEVDVGSRMVWSGVGTGELCDVVLNALCSALRLAASKDVHLQTVARLLLEAAKLEDLLRIPRWLANTRSPVCRAYLERSLQLIRAQRHPLASTLVPVLRRLNWVPGEGFLRAKMASADIFVTETLHIGVTLVAPYTQVPLYITRADEVCLPLSDTMWEQNLQTLKTPLLNRVPHEVGQSRIWEASEPHGMATAEHPLIILWMRYGDLSLPPKLYDDPKSDFVKDDLVRPRTCHFASTSTAASGQLRLTPRYALDAVRRCADETSIVAVRRPQSSA